MYCTWEYFCCNSGNKNPPLKLFCFVCTWHRLEQKTRLSLWTCHRSIINNLKSSLHICHPKITLPLYLVLFSTEIDPRLYPECVSLHLSPHSHKSVLLLHSCNSSAVFITVHWPWGNKDKMFHNTIDI